MAKAAMQAPLGEDGALGMVSDMCDSGYIRHPVNLRRKKYTPSQGRLAGISTDHFCNSVSSSLNIR